MSSDDEIESFPVDIEVFRSSKCSRGLHLDCSLCLGPKSCPEASPVSSDDEIESFPVDIEVFSIQTCLVGEIGASLSVKLGEISDPRCLRTSDLLRFRSSNVRFSKDGGFDGALCPNYL